MTTFIAVYRGDSVATARIVAISSDPTVVSEVTAAILTVPRVETDPVLREVEEGRRSGLRLISTEAKS